jgi:hypothetical protein
VTSLSVAIFRPDGEINDGEDYGPGQQSKADECTLTFLILLGTWHISSSTMCIIQDIDRGGMG